MNTPFDELRIAKLAYLTFPEPELYILNTQEDGEEGECKRMAVTAGQLDNLCVDWLKVRLTGARDG